MADIMIASIKWQEIGEGWFVKELNGQRFNWYVGDYPFAEALEATGRKDVILVLELDEKGLHVAILDPETDEELLTADGHQADVLCDAWFREAWLQQHPLSVQC